MVITVMIALAQGPEPNKIIDCRAFHPLCPTPQMGNAVDRPRVVLHQDGPND